MTWYALQVHSGKEPRAVNYLAQRNYRPYWPHFFVRGKWRAHKSRQITRAAIPGYLFLQAFQPDWQKVFESPGVYGVLRDGDSPYELSDSDMRKIHNIDQAVNASPINAARGIPFRVGQRVRLIPTIWENWESSILAIDKSGQLAIEVPILGGRRVARIAAADVEAL